MPTWPAALTPEATPEMTALSELLARMVPPTKAQAVVSAARHRGAKAAEAPPEGMAPKATAVQQDASVTNEVATQPRAACAGADMPSGGGGDGGDDGGAHVPFVR